MKTIVRHIIGYAVGISIFGYLIPLGLIKFANTYQFFFIDTSKFDTFLNIIIAAIFLLGMLFAVWSNISLFRVGKGGPADGFNVAISPRTKKLVVKGPYRFCRHPMVFGAFCCYFSIALYMRSISCFILLLLCIGLVIVYLKNTEEKRLLKEFGKEYIEYKKRAPMLFPKNLIKHILGHV